MRVVAIAALMLALNVSVAAAQTEPAIETPEALQRAYQCAEIQDNTQRLACYDDAVGRLREAQSTGQVVALDRERVRSLNRESFGFSLPNLSRLLPGGDGAELPDRIESTVVRVVRRANGYHAFVLENGQTWVQVEAENARNVRVGDAIAVRRASMGSYMLSPARGSAHRVRRED